MIFKNRWREKCKNWQRFAVQADKRRKVEMQRADKWEAIADTFHTMLKDPYWVPSTESYCVAVDEQEYLSAMSIYADLKQEESK